MAKRQVKSAGLGSRQRNQPSKRETVTKEQVKQMILSDKVNLVKYVDSLPTYSGVGSSTLISTGVMPTIGTGETSMGGNSVNFTKMNLRGFAALYNTTPNLTDTYFIRFSVIQLVAQGSPTVADIYEYYSPRDIITSPFRYDTTGKLFRVIADYTRKLDPYNMSVDIQMNDLEMKVKRARYDFLDSIWSNGQILYVRTVFTTGTSSNLYWDNTFRSYYYDV